jgi:hypothetical protein
MGCGVCAIRLTFRECSAKNSARIQKAEFVPIIVRLLAIGRYIATLVPPAQHFTMLHSLPAFASSVGIQPIQ